MFYAIVVAGSVGSLSEVYGDLQHAAGAAERLAVTGQALSELVNGRTGARRPVRP